MCASVNLSSHMDLYGMTVYVLERKGSWMGVFSSPQTAKQVFAQDLVHEQRMGVAECKYELVKVDIDDSIYGNRGVVRNWTPTYRSS